MRRPPESRGQQAALPTGRVKVIERFGGHRVRNHAGFWRRVRSLVGLVLIGLVLAAILASVVAVIVGSIALAVQHTLGN